MSLMLFPFSPSSWIENHLKRKEEEVDSNLTTREKRVVVVVVIRLPIFLKGATAIRPSARLNLFSLRPSLVMTNGPKEEEEKESPFLLWIFI